ncbi:hypothetical protein TA05_17600 [Citrobacter rodentium]|uniref:autotransporter outer membrane beta-barrel domain-containing protein n=1 Tax=Citrobacter rodentium TaxID=67825 RepID=UPI0005AED3B3|nr:autotransporter outer membrane beta-barrel domain-containing protein [Citrobacter rodentium]KIQ50077.1 hypothetical protein TA05_17600 [Citrobacter rodentium]
MKITAFRKFSETQRVFGLGICCLGLAVYPGYAQAATIGSQTGVLIEVSDGDHIIADTADYGFFGVKTDAGQQATVRLGSGVTVTADDPDNSARGVMVQGADSVLTADRLTINVSGKNAKGLWLSSDTIQADLGAGSVITASASDGSAEGVIVENGSALTADQLTVEVTGDNNNKGLNISDYGSRADLGSGSVISTNGINSTGIFVAGLNGNAALGAAQLTATELSIKAEGYGAYGINIQKDAVVDIGTGSVITAAGKYAMGIWNLGQFSADGLTIDVQGDNANGIEVRSGSATVGADSHISSATGNALVASDSDATIIFRGSDSARNTLFSGGSAASAQTPESSITLSDTDITVDRGGNLALGLWAMNGGTISGENLSVTGAAGTVGLYVMTRGHIDLTGDLSVSMASADEIAFYSAHYEGYAPGSISATGKMLIAGSVYARGGEIDIAMAPGSLWTGKALSDNVNGGYLNISLNDSVWNISGSSNLDNLSLTGSTVDFASMASDPDVFSTLTVASLSGNGSFVMRTDLVGDGNGVNNGGDLLRVTGSSAGSHLLTFKNQGSMATTGNEVLTVVETADGGASFTAASDIELGGYLYRVRQNGTDWELYSSAQAPDPVPTPEPASIPEPAPTPVPAPAHGRPQLTSAADAGGNYLNVGYVLSYVETSTLMQRMGDLRQQGGQGDMWIRGYGGKADSFAGGSLDGFSMNYSGFQIGADKRVSEDLPLSVGLFLGTTRASPDYRGGDGSVRSDYAGLYASWIAANGFYSDLVLKGSRQKNSFTVRDSQNNRVSGNGNSSGVSVSLEAGQRFALPVTTAGFYAEPQLQFTWNHQNSTGMRASNGLDTDLGSYESLLGRASLLLGYEKETGNSRVNVYLKTGAIREFAGDTSFTLNGSRENHSFRGNGWNNGLGVSAQFNNAHTLYLEVDSTSGETFNQRQVNAGYRFSF